MTVIVTSVKLSIRSIFFRDVVGNLTDPDWTSLLFTASVKTFVSDTEPITEQKWLIIEFQASGP